MITEGLSALIRRAERRESLHGIAVTKRAPKVSHLLFANDSYFFFNANVREANCFNHIMDIYSTASGQMTNLDKSSVIYSPNVDNMIRDVLGGILGVRNSGLPRKYLGLPEVVGRNKKRNVGVH